MPYERSTRPIGHVILLGGNTILVALVTQGALLAQDPSTLLRDFNGMVACVVSTGSVSTAQRAGEGDRIVVKLRAPVTPISAIASKLPVGSQDFSTFPIEVFIVPSARDGDSMAAKPSRVEPLSIDPTLVRPIVDGMQMNDSFVRVTYPRDVLKAGYDIVAQRTAVAENGEKVISQTRCRIREEDAANGNSLAASLGPWSLCLRSLRPRLRAHVFLARYGEASPVASREQSHREAGRARP